MLVELVGDSMLIYSLKWQKYACIMFQTSFSTMPSVVKNFMVDSVSSDNKICDLENLV